MTQPTELGEISKEFTESYFQDLFASRQRTEEILSSGQFVNWLETYTAQNFEVSNNRVAHDEELRDSPDRETIDCLSDFVVSVYDYIEMNYIDIGQERPQVTHNSVTYRVAAMYGQGSFFHIMRLKEPEPTSFTVEYADVLAGEKTERAKEIDNKLHKLGNRILNLVDELQIPEEAIIKTARGAFLATKLDESLQDD